MKRRVIFILMLQLLTITGWAQRKIEVKASISPKEIQIGDWVTLQIELTHGKEVKLLWPPLNDKITIDSNRHLTIIKSEKIDTIISDLVMTQKRILTISAYDSGNYTIPPLKFAYQYAGSDSVFETASLPMLLAVKTIPVGENAKLKPEKGPVGVLPFWYDNSYYWVIGGSILLILLSVAIFLIKGRPRRQKERFIATRPSTAHEQAFESLEQLSTDMASAKVPPPVLYAQLSIIVRTYLEQRYSISALENTTEEILLALARTNLDSKERQQIKELLVITDLVKFAKAATFETELKQGIAKAQQMVERTAYEAPSISEEHG